MKLEVNIEDLKSGLMAGTKILLNPRNLNPSVDERLVLLEVKEDFLSIKFPGYVSMDVNFIECQADGEFSVRVDPDIILSYISAKTGSVEISFDEKHKLSMVSGRGRMTSVYKDASSHLPSKGVSGEPFMTVWSSYFVSVLKRATMFVKVDEFRQNLECVFLKSGKGVLEIAATDRFRCFRHRKQVEEASEGEIQISPAASGLLFHYLDKVDTKVLFYSNDKYSAIAFDDVVIYDLKYDRGFPNYSALFDRFDKVASVMANKKTLLDSASLAKSVVKMATLDVSVGNPLALSITDYGTGVHLEEEVPVTSFEGESKVFYTYPSSFCDAVRAVLGEDALLEITDNRYKLRNPKYPSDEIVGSFVLNF